MPEREKVNLQVDEVLLWLIKYYAGEAERVIVMPKKNARETPKNIRRNKV